MNVAIFFGVAMLVFGVFAVAAGVSRFSQFYRKELLVEQERRALPLDGLRGLAALMVVVHHAALFQNWLSKDIWGEAPDWLQAFGPAGVHLFFMLTGFLFWSKARAENGKFKIIKLWRGRLFRIAPLYLFTAALVVVVAVAINGLQVFGSKNWPALLRVLGLGALPWRAFANGFNPAHINARVVWTLRFEWLFYLVLPFVAWFAVGRRIFWFAAAGYVVFFGLAFLGIDLRLQLALTFLFGMLCPVLLDNDKLRLQLHSRTAAGAGVVAAILLAVSNRQPFFSLNFALALFPIFLLAAAGNSFWGILTARATRCLGVISYSLYLLHGIVFYILMNGLKAAHLATLSEVSYWAIVTVAAMLTACLSSVTFQYIESPFLTKSHKSPASLAQVGPQPILAP